MEKKPINLAHNLLGCRLDNWIRLLKENPVTPENKRQVRFMIFMAFVLGIPAFFEWLIFYIPIKRTKLKKHPVYIVGHWRTGTTMLQNLMTRDPQFAWFDPINTMAFNNSILLKKPIAYAMKKLNLLGGARPMDNLEYTFDLPMEEVFAQATISTQAIAHMLVFPDGGKGVKFIETAFIDEQPECKQRGWKKAYDYLLRKVSWMKGGKQFLLKSPENTCRIGMLKRCYPGSKFINIYRDPYVTIMSTANMFKKEMALFCLNEKPSDEFIEDTIIDLFERIYRKTFNELYAMPESDYIDICYEDFCEDPKSYLKQIYEQLGLEGYEEALPHFEEYLDSQKGYKKNKFHLDKNLRDKINDRLGFYFEHYGYEMMTDDMEEN